MIGGAIALLTLIQLVQWWREQQYSFNGKTVLITGGSRGLGLVMARQLVQVGAQVAICARDATELEQAKAELEQQGGQVLSVACDITDRAQVEHMIQTVHDRFGEIGVLINNAGIIQVAPMELLTLEDYDEAMKLHFWAPLYTTLAVLPEMLQRHTGRIGNISSIGGKVCAPHLLPYGASKFALVGLSEGMRAELAKEGIVVTTVCPGLIRTGSPHNAIFKGQHRKEYAWFSISDSLPILSMSAEAFARKLLAACKRGDAEIILSLPAQIGARIHGLFPGLTADVLSWINRFLPKAGGIGQEQVSGQDSHSLLSPSVLTTLGDRAAQQNNEISATELEKRQSDRQVEEPPTR
jgi:short-subunit dehydrogenase